MAWARYAHARWEDFGIGNRARHRGATLAPRKRDREPRDKPTPPAPKATTPTIDRKTLMSQATAMLRAHGYYPPARERKPQSVARREREQARLDRMAASFERARADRERRYRLAQIGQKSFSD